MACKTRTEFLPLLLVKAQDLLEKRKKERRKGLEILKARHETSFLFQFQTTIDFTKCKNEMDSRSIMENGFTITVSAERMENSYSKIDIRLKLKTFNSIHCDQVLSFES